jgi:hypothetical protein
MTVLLIDVMTSVLIIVIVRVPINLLSRPPLVVITTVARVTILPRTTIILYILKLTAHILKPRVYVEPVLNLIPLRGRRFPSLLLQNGLIASDRRLWLCLLVVLTDPRKRENLLVGRPIVTKSVSNRSPSSRTTYDLVSRSDPRVRCRQALVNFRGEF